MTVADSTGIYWLFAGGNHVVTRCGVEQLIWLHKVNTLVHSSSGTTLLVLM